MCTLCYSAGHPLRVADLLPQGPTAIRVLQNLCYSTTWRMGASKAVCFMNWGAILLYFERSKLQSHQKGATVLLPYLGSWPPIAVGDHMMSCCIAPSLQAMEKALMDDAHKIVV